jgi:hypothetical protein
LADAGDRRAQRLLGLVDNLNATFPPHN